MDAFQRGKAAIAAAMVTLLKQASLDWGQIRRLCVCGSFGRHLHLGHAMQAGLLPNLPPAMVEFHGNAALTGCKMALLSPQGENSFLPVKEKIRSLNLSLVEEYDDCFIDQLRLQPIIFGA